jgi:hypothetical protein
MREIYEAYGNVVGERGPGFPPKVKLQPLSLPRKTSK